MRITGRASMGDVDRRGQWQFPLKLPSAELRYVHGPTASSDRTGHLEILPMLSHIVPYN